ncbi:MAG: TIGR00282 family metallophosphoesterase [Candidatus Saccharimonadales bacterium]
MNILYLGDVMSEMGLMLIERELPDLRKELNIDFVVAQAENVTNGKGISELDFRRLLDAGIDACTGGNWSLHNDSIYDSLNNPACPIVRPANYPAGTPGLGYKYVEAQEGKVLVISLLGDIVGRDSEKPTDNPLQVIDKILDKEKDTPKLATVINFHGDFSSQKVIIGHYLDGRASLVVGDHWHVPTNDVQILPGGTAHQSDVGMCGSLDSSLGIKFDSVLPRWRDGRQTPNIPETSGRAQINGLLVTVDTATGLAIDAAVIRRVYS